MKEPMYNQLIFVIGASFGSLCYLLTKNLLDALAVAFLTGIVSYFGKEFAKHIHNKFKTKQNV